MFKWHIARFVIKDKYFKDMSYNEIRLCAQNICLVVEKIEKLHAVTEKRIFTLTSYNF